MLCISAGNLAYGDEEDRSIPIFEDALEGKWSNVKKRLQAREWHIDESDYEGMTLLHYAVLEGNNDAIIMLLDAGADKNVKTFGGIPTPYEMAKSNPKISDSVKKRLYTRVTGIQTEGEDMIFSALRAAKAQDWQRVRASIIGIPAKSFDTADDEGRTLLHYVAMHGSIKDINEILNKKIDRSILDIKDDHGKYPFDYSISNKKIHDTQQKYLMDKKTKKQYDLLEKLRLDGHNKTAIKKLLLDGANPNDSVPFHPYSGYSPFLIAVRYGLTNTIPVLLEHGADINVQAPDGVTYPLLAVSGPHELRFDLLNRCNKIKSEDNHGRNILFYASISDWMPEHIIYAARIIKDINHQDKDGNTALMHACMRDKVVPSGLLILLGADPSIKNKYGENCYNTVSEPTFEPYIRRAKKWLIENNMPTDRQGILDQYPIVFGKRN